MRILKTTTDKEIDAAVAAMTSAERVALYNATTGKNIKKFSTKAAGIRQLTAALRVARDRLPEIDEPKPKRSRAKAVSESWSVESVRRARCERFRVFVIDKGGKEATYRSTAAACAALRISLSRMMKFRKELKAKRQAEIDGHHFSIIEK